jgi:hypothetical protein
MISFIHYKNSPNSGDHYSTPAHYFDFPGKKVFHISQLLKGLVPESTAAIFGGGSIEPVLRLRKIHHSISAKYKIAWGVGTSAHGKVTHGPLVDDLDLLGIREYGREASVAGAVYVPCASCMLPQLEKTHEVRHDVVLFVNADEKIAKPAIKGIPTLDNTASIDAILNWFGSADTVVTNSFHGVYWATLMKKKVVCLPYSSKFHGFKFPPVMSDEASWKGAMASATVYSEALEDCRAINQTFYRRVQDLIAS